MNIIEKAVGRRVLALDWVRPAPGRLRSSLARRVLAPRRAPSERLIQQRIAITAKAGTLPLWHGYDDIADYPAATAGSSRSVNQVSAGRLTGRIYARLVRRLTPDVVVEFGTAFGVSGMFWLGGLEDQGRGHLFTFEPNAAWAALAMENLKAVGDRFTAVQDTFESAAPAVLNGAAIDVALVDAIHTSEFVERQFEIVTSFAHSGTIVILDDINFSDDMRQCWMTIASRSDVVAAVAIGRRLGAVELR